MALKEVVHSINLSTQSKSCYYKYELKVELMKTEYFSLKAQFLFKILFLLIKKKPFLHDYYF